MPLETAAFPLPLNSSGVRRVSRTIYVSRARQRYSQNRLMGFCADFAARNARHGITGFMIVAGDHFVQILEGDPQSVAALVARIQHDRRHTDFRILLQKAGQCPAFAQWSMGLANLNDDYQLSMSDTQALKQRVTAIINAADKPRDGMMALIRSLPTLLSAYAVRKPA